MVGLGGSACNDAGLGSLTELGLVVCDTDGLPVSPGLAGLLHINQADTSNSILDLTKQTFGAFATSITHCVLHAWVTRVYAPQNGLETTDI